MTLLTAKQILGDKLSHLSLLLQVGSALLVGLRIGLLLLEHRLGDGDVVLGGNTGQRRISNIRGDDGN